MNELSRSSQSDCGCCAGVAVQTPTAVNNRPGLGALAYRAGTHGAFRHSMLARLAAAKWASLGQLRSRDQDDFTIALLDAWAVVGDVLTFYQERIANESYLRTATQRLSILELARLIGYQLAPGLAASTHLVFTLEDAPGAPEQAAKPLFLPIGARAQSVPGPGEEAQIFETTEEIEARPEWNAIAVQTSERWRPKYADTGLYVTGIVNQLQPGDVILIVGAHRMTNPGSERWDMRVLQSVTPDAKNNRTYLGWREGLGHDQPFMLPADEPANVFVFRQRAALFGHNAPDPRMYNTTGTQIIDFLTDDGKAWEDFKIRNNEVDLDAVYPKILSGSWFALVSDEKLNTNASLPGYVELYKAKAVTHLSRNDFGISGRITRLSPDTTENLSRYQLRGTLVLAQSEELSVAERQWTYPIYGVELPLNSRVEGLVPGRPIAISGKRQRLRIAEQSNAPVLNFDGGGSVVLKPDDILSFAGQPVKLIGAVAHALTPAQFDAALNEDPAPLLRLEVIDRDGRTGAVILQTASIRLEPAGADDATVSEIAFVDDAPDSAVIHDRDRTTIKLASPLVYVYDRATVRINANVAAATHGESVKEILGSGDGMTPYQIFNLRHTPLTYVGADTPSGSASTLKVYVNDVLWRETRFLYGRAPSDHVYVSRRDDAGRTTIQFGDGITGARLPTGQNNVRAEYRKGTGLGGLAAAGQISQLLSRPLGLKEVVNRAVAQGAEDPESRDDARRNAPLTVLTLDRAVSLRDYEDFARTFAGVAKAQAVWVWDGRKRSVFITVAGPEGAELDEEGAVLTQLKAALRSYGDPYVAFTVKNYRKVLFQLHGTVTIHSDHVIDTVMAAVTEVLRNAYSFELRQFGQPVALSELVAVIHAIPGVVAVDIDKFYRIDMPSPPLKPRLDAESPAMGADGLVPAAELLLLDEASLNHLGAAQ